MSNVYALPAKKNYTIYIPASNISYFHKDLIKSFGFKWDNELKTWWLITDDHDHPFLHYILFSPALRDLRVVFDKLDI